MDTERYKRGLQARKEVLGSEYVNRQLEEREQSVFYRKWQRYLTEEGWGGVWTRSGLDRKTRSLICIVTLATQGRSHELSLHIKGARRNGWSIEEISEILIHLSSYAGLPTAVEAFRVADEAFSEEDAKSIPSKGASYED